MATKAADGAQIAIRWHSDGNQMAIRWRSDGNQIAIRWHSDGAQRRHPDNTHWLSVI